jgi:N-acetylmuramoyl-L-alanine amidase
MGATPIPEMGGACVKVVWLKGDYTGKNKERQRQAAKEKCDIVIEFHFNSADDKAASGTEVWHRRYSMFSRRLASILHDKITALGFKPRGVKSAVPTSRAAFINAYPTTCLVVLLEPCFVSNRSDAEKLHQGGFIDKLANAIVSGIQDFLKTVIHRQFVVIGLSVGHRHKTSSPNDKGAPCVLGDWEADHAEALAKKVAAFLQS